MEDNRDRDRKHKLVPMKETGKARKPVSLDVVKSAYIAEGLSPKEISDRYFLDLNQVKSLIEQHKLEELRKAYIRQGLNELQNKQLAQTQKLMDMEANFKKLRIIQLEKELEDYVAYYQRHGDFYKRHPVSNEILRNTNGIPMQIRIPNAYNEIKQLKESVTVSEGLKELLTRLDDILNNAPEEELFDSDVIDVSAYDSLFTQTIEEEEDE